MQMVRVHENRNVKGIMQRKEKKRREDVVASIIASDCLSGHRTGLYYVSKVDFDVDLTALGLCNKNPYLAR